MIAQLQLKAAVDAKDNAATLAGLQAVLSSGYLAQAETLPLYMNLGQLNYNAKNYDPAATAFEQVLKVDPNHLEAMVMLAETRNGQGRAAEAVSLIEKAIAAQVRRRAEGRRNLVQAFRSAGVQRQAADRAGAQPQVGLPLIRAPRPGATPSASTSRRASWTTAG